MGSSKSNKKSVTPKYEPEMDCSHITFRAQPPMTFDIDARIKELRAQLEPGYPLFVPDYQHVNICAAIKLYEEGKIKGEQVFLKEGQIVSEEEAYKGDKPFSVEGIVFQRPNKYAYGRGPFGPNNHEVSIIYFLYSFFFD
jgi:hypothetical protein